MLAFHQIPDTNILEFELDGAFKRDDFDRLAVMADAIIEEHGAIKMIEVIKHIGKIQPSALWADLKWTPRHLKYMTHLAVVADQKWIGWIVGPMRAFIDAEVHSFHLDEIEDARRWIAESEESVA